MKRIKKILWPTDFSELANQAVETVCSLAKAFRSRVIICHIVQPVPVAVPAVTFDVANYEKEMLKSARANLQQLAISLRRKGRQLKIKTLTEVGQPAESITGIASRYQVDLIVLCTHGRTGFNHFLFGSVAERVMRTSPCPVLVIRAREKKAGKD